MRRLLGLVVLALLAPVLPAAATPTTSLELDREPEAWDGKVVTLQGELVGDYSIRREGVWVQLNDDVYVDAPVAGGGELAGANLGVGLRIPLELFDSSWGTPGRYRVRGPIVEVTGTFRFHDPAHLGETFVDVTSLELVEPSRQLPAENVVWPWQVGGGLLVLGAGFWLLARFRGSGFRVRTLNPKH